MLLTLKRLNFGHDGILSVLSDASGAPIASTLEHAYPIDYTGLTYAPKIPPGVYSCSRGAHRLHGMSEDFETFEVCGVAGHKGILFHWGNFNRDSEGCILVGTGFSQSDKGEAMVINSRKAFVGLMLYLNGLDHFTLTVTK